MKIKVLRLAVIMAVLLIGSHSLKAQVKNVFTGNWSFDAPSAPGGYTKGFMEVKKDSVLTSFPDMSFKYPSMWVKVKNDSLIYEVNIDGEEVLFSLKTDDKTKITGNAVWSSGETIIYASKK